MTGRATARIAALAALLVAIAALAVVLVGGGAGTYHLHVRFADAGQLVVGDQAQVGGRPVGRVEKIAIVKGLADVELTIDDDQLTPLHEGTRAEIGTPGLSGVANRYVRLIPGSDATPALLDGATLGPQNTRGIVDIDQLLDELDATSRRRLQVILRKSATVFAGRGGKDANRTLQLLNPALSRVNALGSELVADQAALTGLIRSTAQVSGTLAAPSTQLGSAVSSTADALEVVAARRAALGDALRRAPGVLHQATGTLARTRRTLRVADPAVRHLRPVAAPLATLLRDVGPVVKNTRPALRDVNALLPQAERKLSAFPATARTAVPAIASVTSAFKGLQPVVTGLRPYTPDLISGFFGGFLGNYSGYYDANGHYARVLVNFGAGSATGIGPLLQKIVGGSGDTAGTTTGLLTRCPGGGTDPADDESNPYVPDDVPGLCTKSGKAAR